MKLRGFLVVCGPPISESDWWVLAEGVAEGVVIANQQWMRDRDLRTLGLDTNQVRYVPDLPVLLAGQWWQGVKLAPAVLHARAGSCLDLAAYHVALLRERNLAHRRRNPNSPRVKLLMDPQSGQGHAIASDGRQIWDPAKDLQ